MGVFWVGEAVVCGEQRYVGTDGIWGSTTCAPRWGSGGTRRAKGAGATEAREAKSKGVAGAQGLLGAQHHKAIGWG